MSGPAGGVKTIVCGANNYEVGNRVLVALPGAVLPGNFQIKQSKIRGQSSDGMMCSAKEIGMGEDASGLLILAGKPALGTPINEGAAAGRHRASTSKSRPIGPTASRTSASRANWPRGSSCRCCIRRKNSAATAAAAPRAVSCCAMSAFDRPEALSALHRARHHWHQDRSESRRGCRSALRRSACARSTMSSTWETT